MQPNLVLILVESWGKPLTSGLNESLLRPYSARGLPERYTLSQGVVPFYGPTVDGEARELCGSAIGFGLLSASASLLKTCLPARLNAMGYHTMGVHGFNARMFERGTWYPRIGFEEIMFRDQFQPQGLPACLRSISRRFAMWPSRRGSGIDCKGSTGLSTVHLLGHTELSFACAGPESSRRLLPRAPRFRQLRRVTLCAHGINWSSTYTAQLPS